METKNKILGVIGGMGPLATELFYRMIIENTQAACDQEHIDMIILSHATMPDRTEAIKSGNVEELFEKLLADGRFLENSGAHCIAIPCNTSHTLIGRLQENLGIPIVNMIEEAAEDVKKKAGGSGAKVGIMATDGTIAMKLYQNACEDRGIVPVIPTEENQQLVMKIIYDGIKDGGEIDYDDFLKIEKEFMDAGCKHVIMACTELSCFKNMYGLSDYYIDAMESLARKSILLCDKKIRRRG